MPSTSKSIGCLHRAVVVLVLGLPLAAVTAHAGAPAAPWEGEPFAADPQAILAAAGPVPKETEHHAVVLFMDARYNYDEQGRETFVRRMVYRLLDPQTHESWSVVEQPWSPWHQERPVLRARVITGDGRVHELDPATIDESPLSEESPRLYQDARLLRAPLPAVGRGAIVEEEVTIRERAPFFDRGVVRFEALSGPVVKHARVTVETPADAPLTWVMRLLPEPAPVETVEQGRRRLVFELRDLEPERRFEPLMPGDLPRLPYVAFATGRSWAEVARRYSEMVDEAVRGADLSGLLREAAAGPPPGSQLELVDRFLAQVHAEVRYTAVELGEASIVPRPPAETLKRKFGDCKDQATLLVALLRARDIPAYVALLNAGEGQDVEPSLPGLGDFNHAIVFVPGTPPVWIDPTDPYARAGELPEGDQGRLALVASPSTKDLLRTPEATAAENREVTTYEFALRETGPARLVMTTELSGAKERTLRTVFGIAGDMAREGLAEHLSSTYLVEKLDRLDRSEPADLSRPFSVRMEMDRAGRGQTDLTKAAVGIPLGPLFDGLPSELIEEPDEERQTDYVVLPFANEARYRIVPPPGFAPRELPQSRTRDLGPATLAESYEAAADGVVTATLVFEHAKRRVSVAEVAALRQTLADIEAEPPTAIWFDQVGEAHLAGGRVSEALAEFRRLAAAQPKAALPRSRAARALLAGGIGEAAREEARRAVELEPTSAAAHAALGWVLQHDAIGRRFGKGFDRQAALAAYREAVELAPEEPVVRGDLAILLEHDAHGARYAPGADLAAAIAEYEKLREDEVTGLDDNLLVALLRAGRFADLNKLLDEVGSGTQDRQALSLAATAALDGAKVAARQADRSVPDTAARLLVLQKAASNLIMVRRYAEAAALVAHAGKGSTEAAALLARADLLRRIRRHEEVELPLDRPSGPVRRLQILALTQGDPQAMLALMTPEVARGTTAEELGGGLAFLRSQVGQEGMSLDVVLDTVLAGMSEQVQGDDAKGYRVRLATPGDAMSIVAYVVRHGGEYRIAALENDLGPLGEEALRRLEAGDLAGARQWLDWAREGLSEPEVADPLAAHSFATLWREGAESDLDEARCAAHTLLTDAANAERSLPVLARCRDAATDAARRAAFEKATLAAQVELERHEGALETARRLRAAWPASDAAFHLEMLALGVPGRWEELRRVAEERLAARPDDPDALAALVDVAMRRGDFPEMERLAARLEALGEGDRVANNVAWAALARGGVGPRDIERAQRAAAADGYENHASLHTLASLYAEVGQMAEAYRLVIQAIAAARGEPSAHDWYVFGRLAEHYGLPDAARAYYARVEEPEPRRTDPTSTWNLTQRRLGALEGIASARSRR